MYYHRGTKIILVTIYIRIEKGVVEKLRGMHENGTDIRNMHLRMMSEQSTSCAQGGLCISIAPCWVTEMTQKHTNSPHTHTHICTVIFGVTCYRLLY